MRDAFALFFDKKYWQIWDINVWNFNKMLTNDVVSFEQPGPGLQIKLWLPQGLRIWSVEH